MALEEKKAQMQSTIEDFKVTYEKFETQMAMSTTESKPTEREKLKSERKTD